MRFSLFVGVMVAVGCASPGELAFTTELVDFGPALPGVERIQSVDLINRGGSTVVLAEARSTNPAFSISSLPRMTFSPGEIRAVSVHYVPRAEIAEPEEATVEVLTEEGVRAALRVSGTPTSPDCALPVSLDFGAVARGETMVLEVTLQNSTAFPGTAVVGVVETFQEPVFSATSGTFELPPSSGQSVAISFSPTEARDYAATIRLRRHLLCAEKPVRLIGTGVGATLSWTPPTADFGDVTTGTTARFEVTFRNLMFRPLVLTDLEFLEGANTSAVFSGGTAPTLTVPPARRDATGLLGIAPGEATLELTFAPMVAGPRAGQLSARTDLTSQPMIRLNLRGTGMQ